MKDPNDVIRPILITADAALVVADALRQRISTLNLDLDDTPRDVVDVQVADLTRLETEMMKIATGQDTAFLRLAGETFESTDDPMDDVVAIALPVGELCVMQTLCDFHRDDPDDVPYDHGARDRLGQRLDGILSGLDLAPPSPVSDSAEAC